MLHFTQAISGFARALSGEELGYRNFHPQATQALLVRCLDQDHPIEWETAPLPDPPPLDDAGRATFVWLAAHSSGTSAADATFALEVDGRHALDFTTRQAERQRQWTVEGRDGIRLSFDAQWEDAVADLYGYMRLAVPLDLLQPGQPLRLRLLGQAAGRRDWAMTFMYAMRDTVELQAQPALLHTALGPRQLVQALVNILESRSQATLQVMGQEPQVADLELGFNRVAFHLPPVTEPTPFTITLCRHGHADHVEELLLQPVKARELWILPHSHVDVGYSDLQADVERKQLHNLRVAMAEHARTADFPPEARAVWNTEIAWPVQRFLDQATAEEREALFQTLRQGGIGLNAFYTNPLTGICRPEELLRLTEDARLVAQEAGVDLCDAMITDIPGSSLATLTALAQAGIRYYSSGPNYNPGLTGGGDRVGHFNRVWGDRPFWWRTPTGEARVLVWVAGRGYSAFHGSALRREDSGSATRLYDYLRELDAGGYPYDMVQLRYTIGGDNGPVDMELPDFVRHWNEVHISPRLRLSTSAAMFRAFEARWGGQVPEVQGEISPYWEDGALSTLRELRLSRRASERLVQAEGLACLLPDSTFSQEARDEAWRLQHLSSEHTWGAWNSVSEPDSAFVQEQWRVKRGFMEGVDAASRHLLEMALAQDGDGTWLEVVNTSSWPRTDWVCLDAPEGLWRLRSEEGELRPTQRLHTGQLAFVAKQVPPLGSRRYRLEAAEDTPRGQDIAQGFVLCNGLVTVEVDEATGGLRRLTDAEGRDFVMPGAPLNRYLRVVGTEKARLEEATVRRVEVLDSGPVVGWLRVHLQAPGCRALFCDYRVVQDMAHVEVVNHLDREACTEKEAIHFRFPVEMEGRFRADGGFSLLRFPEDSLPGSCRDFVCAGRWLDFSDASHGLTCTTADTPLMQLGTWVDESPDSKGRRQWREAFSPGNAFHTYAMNNYWHTNYAAAQPGPAQLEHRLHPHGAFQPVEAFRRGVEAAQALLPRRVRADQAAASPPLRLDNANLLVSALHPSRDGRAVMVRLFNASLQEQELRLECPGRRPRHSSLGEEAGPPLDGRFVLAPWALLTLRLEA